MTRAPGHIVLVFLVVLSLTGCHRKGRVITAKKLEMIYADMFMADQWLDSRDEARRKADTTLFYEPIFRNYGYTAKDYDATVSHYVDHPDKYVKILRRAAKDLNLKYLEYNRIAERIGRISDRNAAGYGYEMSDFHDADSILAGRLVLDSLLVRDSVYIKEPVTDTVAVSDTLETETVTATEQKIEIQNVERGNRIRPDKEQTSRKFSGDKLAPVRRKDL